MTDTFSRELLRQRVEQILAQPSFPLRYLPTLSGDARLKYPPQPTPRCYRGPNPIRATLPAPIPDHRATTASKMFQIWPIQTSTKAFFLRPSKSVLDCMF